MTTDRQPEPSRSPRLVTITTHGISTRNLMRGQLAYMRQRGFKVIAIASPGWELDEVAHREQVQTVGLPMERAIRPWQDFKSLLAMIRTIRRLRPDIVNAGTPKAALVGMIAAWLNRVPVRIYTMRKLRLENVQGIKRTILWLVEKITALCAQRVICVSHSARLLYIDKRLATIDKTVVLAAGASNGIDPDRFQPTPQRRERSETLRRELGIPADVPVVGFVGRLARDKGIAQLLLAYDLIRARQPKAWLLLVGGHDNTDRLPDSVCKRLENDSQIVVTGYVKETADYYGMIDVVAFPSFGEGFPNVPLEAAAAEIPVVGFEATGTIDAIEDNVTGRIVSPSDTHALAEATLTYLTSEPLRREHGAAGRARVQKLFRNEIIWDALYQEYCRMLAERGLPLPVDEGMSQVEERAESMAKR